MAFAGTGGGACTAAADAAHEIRGSPTRGRCLWERCNSFTGRQGVGLCFGVAVVMAAVWAGSMTPAGSRCRLALCEARVLGQLCLLWEPVCVLGRWFRSHHFCWPW